MRCTQYFEGMSPDLPFVSARRVPHFASKGSIERLDSAQNLQPRNKRHASPYAYTKVEGFCKRLGESLDESVLFNCIFLVISFVSFEFRAASRLLLFRDAWSVYSQGGLLRLWRRSQETILHRWLWLGFCMDIYQM